MGFLLSAYVGGKVDWILSRKVLRNFEKRATLRGVPSMTGAERLDVSRLASLSLWGKGNAGTPVPFGLSGAAAHPLPSPKAGSLVLKGIVRYPDGTFEGVFFDRRMKKTMVVRAGTRLGDLKVLVIQPDRIIVRIKGKEEAFKLFEVKKKGRSIHRFSGSTSAVTYVRKGTTSRVVLSKKEVKSSLKDMASFLRQVRIIPYMEHGKPQGFQLLDIVPGSIVAKVGLKNGDVIERVNGKPILTPQDAMQFFSALENGNGVVLSVKRRQESMTIAVDLK